MLSKTKAPYVYLAKNQGEANEYYLFIAIIVPIDAEVKRLDNTPAYHADSVIVNFGVDTTNSQSNKFRTYTEKIVLDTSTHAQGAFDKNSTEIEVVVEEHNNNNVIRKSKKSTTFYKHADNTAIGQVGEFIEDAPYLYLSNPQAEVGGTGRFRPRCLVFSKGRLKDDKIAIHSDSCFSTIAIDLSAPSPKPSMIDNLACNKLEYEDKGVINGKFETVVTTSSAAPVIAGDTSTFAAQASGSRRGVRTNKSSNTNPNQFLDTN